MNIQLKVLKIVLLLTFICSVNNCYHSESKENPSLAILGSLNMQKRITIVGDSLSEWSDGFYLSTKLPSQFVVRDVSIAGFTVTDWLARRSQLHASEADLFIIELGTNDAMVTGTQGFRENYQSLIDHLTINPSPNLIFCKLPLTNMASIQSIIATNNQTIGDLTKQSPKYSFVDLQKLFETQTIPLYPLSDPIHPNETGYQLIGDALTKHILGLNI